MKLPRIALGKADKAFSNRKYFWIFDGDENRMTNKDHCEKARKKYKKKL